MKIAQETQNLIVLKDSNLWAWILDVPFIDIRPADSQRINIGF